MIPGIMRRNVHLRKIKMKYSNEQIEQLNRSYEEVGREYWDIFFNKLPSISYNQRRANEFLRHGFSRRFQMLEHCLDSVFNIYPPERDNLLSDEERFDLEVYIQAFVFNMFGCIDNLAWIVNHENDLKLSFTNVSLYNPLIQDAISDKFNEYINKEIEEENCFKKWYDNYCKNFRHSLAHRIPLYVPPCGVTNTDRYAEIENERWDALLAKDFEKVDELNSEEKSLQHILPFYTHSFEENSPQIIIHSQMIADFRTIIELSSLFFEEFQKKPTPVN